MLRQGDWTSGTGQGASCRSSQNLGIPGSPNSPSGSEEEWIEHGFGVSVLHHANCGEFPLTMSVSLTVAGEMSAPADQGVADVGSEAMSSPFISVLALLRTCSGGSRISLSLNQHRIEQDYHLPFPKHMLPTMQSPIT